MAIVNEVMEQTKEWRAELQAKILTLTATMNSSIYSLRDLDLSTYRADSMMRLEPNQDQLATLAEINDQLAPLGLTLFNIDERFGTEAEFKFVDILSSTPQQIVRTRKQLFEAWFEAAVEICSEE